MAVIAIYRTCHLKSSEYTFFSSAHEIFSSIDHISHQLCNENVKGTSLGRKLMGRIRSTETNSKQ